MKLIFNLLLFLSISVLYESTAYSLSDYQIREICQRKQRRLTCIKMMKLKRFNLLEGNKIEIPVEPFKK